MTMSRRDSYSSTDSLMEMSKLSTTPAWRGAGAQTKVYCWSFDIWSMMAAGPAAYPSRQPVQP